MWRTTMAHCTASSATGASLAPRAMASAEALAPWAWTRESASATRSVRWTPSPRRWLEVAATVAPDPSVLDAARPSMMLRGPSASTRRGTRAASTARRVTRAWTPPPWPCTRRRSTARIATARTSDPVDTASDRALALSAWVEPEPEVLPTLPRDASCGWFTSCDVTPSAKIEPTHKISHRFLCFVYFSCTLKHSWCYIRVLFATIDELGCYRAKMCKKVYAKKQTNSN